MGYRQERVRLDLIILQFLVILVPPQFLVKSAETILVDFRVKVDEAKVGKAEVDEGKVELNNDEVEVEGKLRVVL